MNLNNTNDIINNQQSNILIHWNMSGNDIINKTKELVKKSYGINISLTKRTIVSKSDLIDIMSIISNDINEYTSFHSMCNFLQLVSPSNDVKNGCQVADTLLSGYITELNLNKNIYDKIVELYEYGTKNKYLDNVDKIFLNKIINGYKKNGIDLSSDKKELLIKIKKEIIKIETNLFNDLNKENNKIIKFTFNDLHGLPRHIKNKLQIVSDNPVTYGLKLNRSNYASCMKYIKNENVREKIEFFYHTKCSYNLDSLTRLFILKNKYAKLLSYNAYIDYKVDGEMIKNSNNIKNFLTKILGKLDYRFNKEIMTLLKFKKSDKNFVDDRTKLNSWDIDYYITKWKKSYGLNEQKIMEYFPLQHVLSNILKIYQKLFDIKISIEENSFVWYPDVITYRVTDNNNNNELLGFFYLDIYKRKNKYNQIRCFSLQQAFDNANNKQLPISAIMAYFDKPRRDKMTLLSYNDVISFFHEFAHIMHQMLGKTKYSLLSGTNVENDFVEIPAQIIENLCWNKQILKIISSHYVDNSMLPDDLIHKLQNIKNITTGIQYKRHIMYSIFDQMVHSSNNFLGVVEENLKIMDKEEQKKSIISTMSKLYKQLFEKIMICDISKNKITFNDGAFMPTSWINFVSGHDAHYYSYIRNKVASSDIYYQKFNNKNIVQACLELKNAILCKGGSEPAYIMIKKYLGRNIKLDGFMKLYCLENEEEYSFYANTDMVNNYNQQSEYLSELDTVNNDYSNASESNKSNEYTDSYSNNFSECNDTNYENNINEVNDINGISFIKNKLNNYDIDIKIKENNEK